MPSALPPLNALRAFEAAARHLSFTRAAAELHVTQAAVSHQVKALEDRLGIKLFRRMTRRLALTEEGQALLPGLSDAFARMNAAVDRVRGAPTHSVLTLSTLTTFAMSWLVPRLPRFQDLHKTIEVRMSTSARLVDFAREDIDAAIRFGGQAWPGLARHRLFGDRLTPLAHPRFRSRLRRPEDLADVTLLKTTTGPNDVGNEWRAWLDKAGLGRLAPKGGGTVYDSTRIALEAAAAGQGVAVGDPLLAADEIRAGRLFQPFDLVASTGKAYWLVYPESAASRPKIAAFRDWLLAEAAVFARRAEAELSRPAPVRAGSKSGRAAAARPASPTTGRGPGRDDGSGG